MDDMKREEVEKTCKKIHKIQARVVAVRMVYVRNMSVSETAYIQGLCPNRVRNLLHRYDEGGLEGLRDLPKCGRPVILLDNAAYHRYKAVDEFVKSACGEIRLVYLPPYTPQLNPIEIQWRVLKDMLAGRYFGSTNDLIRAITNLIDSGQMKPVRLMNYLCH